MPDHDGNHRCLVEKNVPIAFIFPIRCQEDAESQGMETSSCLCSYTPHTYVVTLIGTHKHKHNLSLSLPYHFVNSICFSFTHPMEQFSRRKEGNLSAQSLCWLVHKEKKFFDFINYWLAAYLTRQRTIYIILIWYTFLPFDLNRKLVFIKQLKPSFSKNEFK